MEKNLKKKLLGVLLILLGFAVMTIYPYLMYMVGDETSYAVIKATLTILVILIGVVMVALGGLLTKGAQSAEDTG
ncbi:MAG: hypothetical protein F7C32_02655 [Desulfurococcales archaeon]|nr:hypothetical protein [Desulfurococcales archaeon]